MGQRYTSDAGHVSRQHHTVYPWASTVSIFRGLGQDFNLWPLSFHSWGLGQTLRRLVTPPHGLEFGPNQTEELRNLEITWLGDSCFRLETTGVIIVTNPYHHSVVGLLESVNPTVVTISNRDPQPNDLKGALNKSLLIEGPGEYSIAGVYIRGVITPVPSGQSYEVINTAYLVEAEGLTLCHLGTALDTMLPTAFINELTPIDVLLMPVGGNSTLSMKQAAATIQALSPKLVVPMDYTPTNFDEELQELQLHLKGAATKSKEVLPKLTVSSTSLPMDTTTIFMAPITHSV